MTGPKKIGLVGFVFRLVTDFYITGLLVPYSLFKIEGDVKDALRT